MIQKQRNIASVTPCRTCGQQPHAYEVCGKTRFFLECSPCEVRTGKTDTLTNAVMLWEQMQEHRAGFAITNLHTRAM